MLAPWLWTWASRTGEYPFLDSEEILYANHRVCRGSLAQERITTDVGYYCSHLNKTPSAGSQSPGQIGLNQFLILSSAFLFPTSLPKRTLNCLLLMSTEQPLRPGVGTVACGLCFCMAYKLRMAYTFVKGCKKEEENADAIAIIMWPAKPKIFTIWLFTEEVCRACLRPRDTIPFPKQMVISTKEGVSNQI